MDHCYDDHTFHMWEIYRRKKKSWMGNSTTAVLCSLRGYMTLIYQVVYMQYLSTGIINLLNYKVHNKGDIHARNIIISNL